MAHLSITYQDKIQHTNIPWAHILLLVYITVVSHANYTNGTAISQLCSATTAELSGVLQIIPDCIAPT